MTSPTPSNSSSGQSNSSDTELPGAPPGTGYVKCSACGLSVATASSRTLPCFHAFCRPCHDDKLHSSGAGGAYVSCPACLAAGAGAGGPPSASAGTTGVCRGCCRSDSPAVELVARCVTCEYAICASCERSHREMAYFSRHRVVPLTPPPAGPGTSSLAVGGPARSTATAGCPVHPGECLSFFCHQCQAAMCRQCCLVDDPTHRRSLLNGADPLTGTTTRASLNGTAPTHVDQHQLGGLSYLEKIAETKAAQLKVRSLVAAQFRLLFPFSFRFTMQFKFQFRFRVDGFFF